MGRAQSSSEADVSPSASASADAATPASRAQRLSTSSRLTRVLGIAGLLLLGIMLAFGLWFSGPEIAMRDSVRLLYIHVPSVFVAYLCFGVTFLGSVQYLRNQSSFWDLMAHAAAEIGVLFVVFVLVTGSLWGKPTWGTYWQWDPRLTSTSMMLLMYVGYLALRRLDLPGEVRSQRAAVLGIVSILNVIVVHYSVKWWRSLHQSQTFGIDTQMDGLMLFSFFLGVIAFLAIGAWLLVHRFRVGWMESQLDEIRLEHALVERRNEGRAYPREDDLLQVRPGES